MLNQSFFINIRVVLVMLCLTSTKLAKYTIKYSYSPHHVQFGMGDICPIQIQRGEYCSIATWSGDVSFLRHYFQHHRVRSAADAVLAQAE